jgi:hypothetical protein
MKKVWPSDDQNAIAMPNNKKRHSPLIKSVVLKDIFEIACAGVIAQITACPCKADKMLLNFYELNIEICQANT